MNDQSNSSPLQALAQLPAEMIHAITRAIPRFAERTQAQAELVAELVQRFSCGVGEKVNTDRLAEVVDLRDVRESLDEAAERAGSFVSRLSEGVAETVPAVVERISSTLADLSPDGREAEEQGTDEPPAAPLVERKPVTRSAAKKAPAKKAPAKKAPAKKAPAKKAPAKKAPAKKAPAKKAPAKKAPATRAPRNNAAGSLAIPGYDALAASQLLPRLESLSVEQLDAVERYERDHRARRTVLSRIAQLKGA